jgi:DNA-binding CsgD family transcriptional regulator
MGRPPKTTKPKTSAAPTPAQAELAALLESGNALVVREDAGGPMPRATLTDEGYKALAAMAAEGQDQASVANAFGMNRSTLQALIKRDQRAEDAMNVGKALLADELTHHLLNAARKGNIIAAIYLTKARLGWREGDAPDVKPNIIINLPDSMSHEQYLNSIKVIEPKEEDK